MLPIGFYFKELENSGYLEWVKYFTKNTKRDCFVISDSVNTFCIKDFPVVNTNEIARNIKYNLVVPFKKECFDAILSLKPFLLIGFEEFSDLQFNYYEYREKEIKDISKKYDIIFDYNFDIYDIDSIIKVVVKGEKEKTI